MNASNEMLLRTNDKTLHRVSLLNELKEFLENGGNVKEYPVGHSVFSTNNQKKITEKKLSDFNEEFNPQINRSIQIDLQAYEHKLNIQNIQKNAQKKEHSIPIKSKSSNNKKMNISTANEKLEVKLPPNTPEAIPVSSKIIKKTAIRTKSNKCDDVKKKSPIKTKTTSFKIKNTEQKVKVSKPRTRSKTKEQAEEYQRRMQITEAKKKALAINEIFFEAPCFIHKMTTYTISKNNSKSARCVACLDEFSVIRKKKGGDNPKSKRLKDNKEALSLAILNNQNIFIGQCSEHGRSAHHVENRQLAHGNKYESRCCECKKYSKYKSEQKNKTPIH